jgi:pSer/pThr/pTyr-binding forkhead associated (FHA) protein
VPPFVLDVLKFALLGLLYLFIYRAVRAISQDLRAKPAREARPRDRGTKRRRTARARGGEPSKLVVRHGGKQRTLKLSRTIQIGRASSCDVSLDDTYVSQLHASVSNRNGTWVVEDLGSTNGTYLNQQRVTVPTEIAPGDRIRIGKTVFEVKR